MTNHGSGLTLLSMADNPEVPDLKKAQANKPAEFVWTPESTVARSSASAQASVGRTPGSSSQGRGKLAVAAILVLFGGFVFFYGASRYAGTSDSGVANLAGIGSTMKVHFGRQSDTTNFIARERAAREQSAHNADMRFDLIGTEAEKAAVVKEAADKLAAEKAAAENPGTPMNYDEGSTSRSGGSGSGASAQAGKAGAQGGAGDIAGGGASRLGSSFGSMKMQTLRRVSGTAGFRNIQGRRGTPNRSLSTGGSSVNAADAAGRSGTSAGGSRFSSAGGSAAGTAGLDSGSADSTSAPAGRRES